MRYHVHNRLSGCVIYSPDESITRRDHDLMMEATVPGPPQSRLSWPRDRRVGNQVLSLAERYGTPPVLSKSLQSALLHEWEFLLFKGHHFLADQGISIKTHVTAGSGHVCSRHPCSERASEFVEPPNKQGRKSAGGPNEQ